MLDDLLATPAPKPPPTSSQKLYILVGLLSRTDRVRPSKPFRTGHAVREMVCSYSYAKRSSNIKVAFPHHTKAIWMGRPPLVSYSLVLPNRLRAERESQSCSERRVPQRGGRSSALSNLLCGKTR